MRKIISLLLPSLFFLSACQQVAKMENRSTDSDFPKDDISIHAKTHKPYDYSGKKYVWVAADISINDPNGKWYAPDFDYDSFLSQAVKNELTRNGLKEAVKSADLIVSYAVDLNMAAIKLKHYKDIEEPLVFKVPEGSLSVIVVDSKTRQVLWTGWAKANYKQRKEEISKQRLNFIIHEIFKQFPQ